MTTMSLSELKSSLTHPLRTFLITNHRRKLAKAAKTPPTPNEKLASSSYVFELNDVSYETRFAEAANKGHVKVIENFENYMGSLGDKAQEIYVLTVIDEPFVNNELCFGDFMSPFNFLVESVGKKVCNLNVSGLPNNKATREMFAVGTRLHLFNPVRQSNVPGVVGERFGVDLRRSNERNTIFPMGRVIGMCRFCGKENARRRCAVCKVPYCSKGCQEADWKLNKHKLVCKQAEVEVKEETSTSGGDEATATTPLNLHEPPATSGLMKPERISRILNFRRKFKGIMEADENDGVIKFRPCCEVSVPDFPLPDSPKPIFLKDMTCDNIYENRAIELTVIEDRLPLVGFQVHYLVEDKNKDVTCLASMELGLQVKGFSSIEFHIGETLLVYHPFYKVGVADGLPMIRLGHVKTIKRLEKRISVCRYCGMENAKRKCAECSTTYCGEECQSKDLEILNHDLICNL